MTHRRTIMNGTEQSDQVRRQRIEQEILLALKGIRYGSIEIIIHDSKVVQIECKEKIRIDTNHSGTNR